MHARKIRIRDFSENRNEKTDKADNSVMVLYSQILPRKRALNHFFLFTRGTDAKRDVIFCFYAKKERERERKSRKI